MKKKILAVFYSVCLLLSLFAERVIRSRKQISDRTNDKIIRTLREAQSCIYDYNDDGLINCIDYACLFKLTWDKKFPAEKSRCSLIRNLQHGKMNHLFAQVQDENSCWIEIEPWTYNLSQYLMTEIWTGNQYNPKFNHYGETEYWISQGHL
ncbi:MAG: hypothetical protein IJT42_04050 [Treponema sp.]|nr:hypothetical protein [Treponema sp.]